MRWAEILEWNRCGVSLPLLLGSTCPSAAGPDVPLPQEDSPKLHSELSRRDGGQCASTSEYIFLVGSLLLEESLP